MWKRVSWNIHATFTEYFVIMIRMLIQRQFHPISKRKNQVPSSDPGRLGYPPIYLHWDFRNLEKNTVWTGKNNQFVFKLGKKIPVWNIKLAKSKIPVRVVKNVISKWTKIEFPRFQFPWFTAVGVVNPPDQKLVMYISVNCKKGINS